MTVHHPVHDRRDAASACFAGGAGGIAQSHASAFVTRPAAVAFVPRGVAAAMKDHPSMSFTMDL
ncbi:hypothetical protein [Bifidobacterium pullorum]|uniref:hypothetical protein n=1 Tax=Bifidobacterium pullorum TaxID=78448 RepID=UPI00307C44C3